MAFIDEHTKDEILSLITKAKFDKAITLTVSCASGISDNLMYEAIKLSAQLNYIEQMGRRTNIDFEMKTRLVMEVVDNLIDLVSRVFE